MRVWLATRSDVEKRPAGDFVQYVELYENLVNLGIDAKIGPHCDEPLDLVHVFNTTRLSDSIRAVRFANSKNIPVVLSPIYWDIPVSNKARKMQALIFTSAKYIMPNCITEMLKIRNGFSVIPTKFRIVNNGVNPKYADSDDSLFRQLADVKSDFILSVGYIGPRKNQLAVVEAANKLNFPVVLIGKVYDSGYFAKVKKAAKTGLTHIDQAPRSVVHSAMKACKVHVLPSQYETPGLANLEAAMMGVPVVTTDQGPQREYLLQDAYYCDGTSDGVFSAISQALEHGPKKELKTRMLEMFTWRKAAEKTLQVYKEAVI